MRELEAAKQIFKRAPRVGTFKPTTWLAQQLGRPGYRDFLNVDQHGAWGGTGHAVKFWEDAWAKGIEENILFIAIRPQGMVFNRRVILMVAAYPGAFVAHDPTYSADKRTNARGVERGTAFFALEFFFRRKEFKVIESALHAHPNAIFHLLKAAELKYKNNVLPLIQAFHVDPSHYSQQNV